MIETLMKEAISKLNSRIINVAKQPTIDALKICEADRNKSILKLTSSMLWMDY